MTNETPSPALASERRKRQPRMVADLSRACRAGRHIPAADIRIDAQGVEHGRCRHCGCELTRMPVLRRWFRTGPMG